MNNYAIYIEHGPGIREATLLCLVETVDSRSS